MPLNGSTFGSQSWVALRLTLSTSVPSESTVVMEWGVLQNRLLVGIPVFFVSSGVRNLSWDLKKSD